jgi:hypothetical protein
MIEAFCVIRLDPRLFRLWMEFRGLAFVMRAGLRLTIDEGVLYHQKPSVIDRILFIIVN